MEHLQLPENVKHFIFAPYEAPEKDWYDNRGFKDYPERRGWTEEQLQGGVDLEVEDFRDPNGFHTKGEPYEVERFFHTWLFFGLAIEFFHLGGVTITTEDLLRPKDTSRVRWADTSKVPDLLVQWRDRVDSAGDAAGVWEKLKDIFDAVQKVLNRFCLPDEDDRPLKREKPRPWPVRDEISTTMIALAHTLRLAALEFCQPRLWNSRQAWPGARSAILAKRLEGKWCLADVAMALKDLPIDGHYYLAASPSPGPEYLDHHYRCLKQRCLYEIDDNLYVTRHADPPWHKPGCTTNVKYGGQLGPERGQKDWLDAVGRIIDKGAIPIALWLKGDHTLWSVEYHLTGTRKPEYVAISHVWADGMGDPHGNSLPECQIDRITHFVEGIRWKDRKDTPENPNLSDGIGFWMDTLCIPTNDDDRRNKAIASMQYVYANAQCILVLDSWLQQIQSDAPMLDIVTYMYQSNWVRRLWTHQEGYLAPTIYVQFKDKAVELQELSDRYQAYKEQMISVGKLVGFPTNANEKMLMEYTTFRWLIQSMDTPDRKWMTYLALANAMSERQTTKLADETVCLATIIDIDVKQFLGISKKPDEESAKKRMALFLKNLKRFQMGLIFNTYERLEIPGLHWAPKSLLNFRTPEKGYLDDQREADLQEVNGKFGLLVEYPGFLVDFKNRKLLFATAERGCVIQCQGSVTSNPDIDGKYFVIELPPNNCQWTATDRYGIILSKIPEVSGDPCLAVVGRTDSEPGEVYTLERYCSATARVLEQPLAWIDQSEYPILAEDTKWLMV